MTWIGLVCLGFLGGARPDCVEGDAAQLEFCGPDLDGLPLATRQLPLGSMDAMAFADARQLCQAPPGTRTPAAQLQADSGASPAVGGCRSNDMWGDGRTPEQRMRENVPFAMAATTCLGRMTRLVCSVNAGNRGPGYYAALATQASHDTDRDDCDARGALTEPSAQECCDVLMTCNVPPIPRPAGDSSTMTLSEWCSSKVWNDGNPVQCSGAMGDSVTPAVFAVLVALLAIASGPPVHVR